MYQSLRHERILILRLNLKTKNIFIHLLSYQKELDNDNIIILNNLIKINFEAQIYDFSK